MRLKQILNEVLELRSILTFLGVSSLLLTVILAIPAWYYSDIVAAGIASTILISLILIILTSIIVSRRLARSLKVEVFLPSVAITSQEPGIITLSLNGLDKLLPGFEIEPILSFHPEELKSIPINRKFLTKDHAVISFKINPPHRGIWEISECRCEIRDILRMTSRIISINLSIPLTINVPVKHLPSLPIYASSSKPGDALIHHNERLGDPFDLRSYQPGDSMRRILWKVYARTGELITRQPESSCTPEGEAWIFCAAPTSDDSTGATCLSYARQILENNINICGGCLGMGNNSPARSLEAFESLIIHSAWNSKIENFISDFSKFINLAEQVSSVILCVSANQLEMIFSSKDILNQRGMIARLLVPSEEVKVTRSNNSIRDIIWENEQKSLILRPNITPVVEFSRAHNWIVIAPEESFAG